jgi:hypothetical protein
VALQRAVIATLRFRRSCSCRRCRSSRSFLSASSFACLRTLFCHEPGQLQCRLNTLVRTNGCKQPVERYLVRSGDDKAALHVAQCALRNVETDTAKFQRNATWLGRGKPPGCGLLLLLPEGLLSQAPGNFLLLSLCYLLATPTVPLLALVQPRP